MKESPDIEAKSYNNSSQSSEKSNLFKGIAIPLLFCGVLVFIIGILDHSSLNSYNLSFKSNIDAPVESNNEKINGFDIPQTCHEDIKYCTNNSVPVLNGLDFVQYFTEFKLSDGVYNESAVGEVGLPEYSYNLNGYTFLFKSQMNLDIFEQSPDRYIPQVSEIHEYLGEL